MARPGILILMFFIYSPFGILGYGQVNKVIQVGSDSDLPQPYIYSLNQDKDGFLWIGTGAGLVKYDGLEFQVFTTGDSLCDDFITCSFSGAGGIWFGHMNGGITFYNGKIFKPVVHPAEAYSSISDIKVREEIVWATTQSGGIWRIESGRDPQLFQDPDHAIPFFSVEPVSSNELILGSMEGVFTCKVNPQTPGLGFLKIMEGIPAGLVQDILLSDNEEVLYILTQEEGIYRYDLNAPGTEPALVYDPWEDEIDSPQHLMEDRQGNLWMPTFGNGLVKLIPDPDGGYGSRVHYSRETGLPDDNIHIVFQDREENLWLGMYGKGLARLVDDAFTFYSLEHLEPNNSIYSVYSSGNYRWFGTSDGLICLDPGHGNAQPFLYGKAGLPGDPVTAICESPQGMLWVGTRNSGIFKWSEDSARFIPVKISEGILENSINSLEFSSMHLYIATERGVCRLDTDTDSIEWFTIGNSDLPHNKVNHLELSSDGKLWVATPGNRVTCFVNDSLISHIIPQINGVLNIRAIMPDTAGSVWIATNGNGILRINGDSIETITTERGLASDFCYSMELDNHGHVWVSHRGSLSRIEGEAGSISTFADESGIPSDMIFNLNASDMDKEGILWFGTSTGIVSFDPRYEKGITPAPALSIRSVLVNNQPVDPVSGLVLGPGRYDLQIQFIGVSLKNPEAVTYQYKMEGLGDRWSDFFDQEYVLFNSLTHGRYRFMVRAMNHEGLISEQPAVVDVLIRKPLWKQWWFFFLEALMAFMVTAGIVKRREYQLRREKQILEQAVRERTEEVVKQKDKIEKQRDAIEIQKNEIEHINQNLNDSMVYGSRIQNAVFPPLKLLNELFPEHFLFFKPHQIVSGDFFWVTKSNGKHIVTVADCTGHGVPGAFMSMLGITYLNELVHTKGILEADQILNHLKSDIIKALRQDESEIISGDGMDMALCIYDPGSSILQYSGGFNPLILVRDGDIDLIKADPMPVGLGAEKETDFTKHELKIHRGDMIYLTSDGYMDQFGGERGKKFSRRRFLDMLLDIHTHPMDIQKQIIGSTLAEWMSEEEQIDDITVLGIRF